MTSEYSVSVDDWTEDDWEFIGRDIMYDYWRTHPKKVKDEGYDEPNEDNWGELSNRETPMMLYAYPIYTTEHNYDEAAFNKKVVDVCLNTNCTVMKKWDTEEYYLALTGGGMDLSQDIALAYILIDRFIPSALALNVSTQCGLSKGGKDWMRIMSECKRSLEGAMGGYKQKINDIDAAVGQQKKKEKEEK